MAARVNVARLRRIVRNRDQYSNRTVIRAENILRRMAEERSRHTTPGQEDGRPSEVMPGYTKLTHGQRAGIRDTAVLVAAMVRDLERMDSPDDPDLSELLHTFRSIRALLHKVRGGSLTHPA